MLAVASKSKRYPIVLPEGSPHPRAPVFRRAARPIWALRAGRRNPVGRALIIAAVVFLPAVLYVSQRTEAARSGYLILRLRDDVGVLQSDNARLLATATALKSPERIEQIAVHRLGMVAPKQQQLSVLTLAPATAAKGGISGPSLWDRFTTWLVGSEAEARETD